MGTEDRSDAGFSSWANPTTPMGFRRAVPWSIVAVGGSQAITALVSFVLAALVGPKDFGTIAIAMVFVFFVQLLVRQGMIQAFVQRKDLTADHANSGFWMVLGVSVVLAFATVLLAGLWAQANRLDDLEPVLIWLSPLIPLQGLAVVQEALLRRRQDFRALAIRTLAAAGFGGIVGIGLALSGWGVWALVAQQLAMAVGTVVALWRVSGWRPQARFSWPHARDLLGFSAGSSLAGLANFANSRADALLIGLFMGPLAVGLYRLASRFTEIVIDLFTRSLQQVALPELSRFQDDPERFQQRSLSVLSSTSIVTIPMLGVLAGISEPLLEVVGDDWAPAVTGLRILCAVTAVRSILLVDAAIVLAAGRPYLNAACAWFSAVVSVVTFVIVGIMVHDAPVTDQVTAIAAARLGVHLVAILPMQLLVMRHGLDLAPWRVLKSSASPTMAAIAAGVAGIASSGLVDALPGPLLRLATTGLLAAVVGGAVLAALDRQRVVDAVVMVRHAAAARGRRSAASPDDVETATR